MTEQKIQPKRLSMSNTKKEMLDAYNSLLKKIQEKKEAELKPEKKIEERKVKEVVEIADSLSTEGVVKGISNLKLEIGRMLTQISDKMEEEVRKYMGIQKAIAFKEKDLQELFEIERSAETLAALIESQNQKRHEYELEMTEAKNELNKEIETRRGEWEKEKMLSKIRKMHAQKRIGKPEEVAEVILFLASSKASFITGAAYLVDGGRMSML